MASANKKLKRYKSLPPHSNEPHPLARMGEVNRTLIISIVVILALIVLALFLFVAKPFAGKAVALPPSTLGPMAIGASLPRGPAGYHALSNEEFSFPISANLVERDGTAHETVAISFQVTLPAGVSCPTIENLLGWTAENGLVTDDSDIRCENNLITFTAATANPFVAKTGLFDIVRLSFNGLDQGSYSFAVHNVVIIDLATGQPLNLMTLSPTILIQNPPIYECTGNIPPNAGLCAGDDQSLSENTPLSLVASCTEARKCEYTCNLPLVLQNNVCVLPEFRCIGPQPANTLLCEGDVASLTQDTPLQLVALCTETTKCELTCNVGFHLEGPACVADTFSCTGNLPANANPCPGDDQGLTQNVPPAVVASCTDAVKCEYTCQDDFSFDDGICVPAEVFPAAQSAVGTKITLEEIAPEGNLYQTKITATEDIDTSFTVVTQLFIIDDASGSERSVVVEVRTLDPLASGITKIIGTQSLGEFIVKKRVVVYDTTDVSQWKVHLNEGTFDVIYMPLN